MRVTIFGAGYVGLVTGACFAEQGNYVMVVDIDTQRIERLKKGDCPIHEPGLTEMLRRHMQNGHLQFSDDVRLGVSHGFYQFIAVGTPQDEDGAADLQYVLAVANSIGQYIQDYRLIVNKSTVPVGTADRVTQVIAEAIKKRKLAIEYDVASNPEFLREGAAISDFMNSDRIIIGTSTARAAEHLRILYTPFNRQHDRLIVMDTRSAELTKYAANTFLAARISLINEISHLAERLGGDIDMVRQGIGSDPRIGRYFINPGCGYGGSCFPKDIMALQQAAREVGFTATMIESIHQVNQAQKLVLFNKMLRYFKHDLQNKVIALWGLAFKPNTDDMREAPSRTIMEALWRAGARIQAYDPVAMSEAERLYGKREDLKLCQDPEVALEGADALVIVTEWSIFSSPDFNLIKSSLRRPVIFDGRNLYDPAYMAKLGFQYYAIGRGEKGYE